MESTEVVMEKNALPDTNGLNMEDCATESVWTDRDTTRPDPEGHEGGQSDGLEYHTVTPSIGGRSRARLRGDIRKDDLLDTNNLPRCVEGDEDTIVAQDIIEPEQGDSSEGQGALEMNV